MQGRDGSLVRPHPVIWRVAHGIGIVYVLLLVCGLFLHVGDIRAFARWVDPSIPRQLDLRSYGEDCRVCEFRFREKRKETERSHHYMETKGA